MNDGTVPGAGAAAGGRPLRLVAWGLLVAFVDLRVGWFDLLPDVVGWLLVAVGVRRLAAGRAPGPGAPVAYAAALVAAVLSVVDLGLRVLTDGARSDTWSVVAGSGGFALGGEVFSLHAVATVLAVLTLTGVVAGLAERGGDGVTTRRWTRLRLVYVCTALPGLAICFLMLLGLGSGAGLVLSSVLVIVGYVVYALVVLRAFRDSRRPWALPGDAVPPPAAGPDATAAAGPASITA